MGTKGTRLIIAVIFLGLLAVRVVLIIFTLQSVQASAGILYVAPGGICGGVSPCYSSVQAAVNAAQVGDEIRVATGTYLKPAGDEQVVYVDKSLTLRGGYTTDWLSPNPEANPTTLNALNQGRVIVITGTQDVTIEGLKLFSGSAAGLGGHNCFTEWDAGGGLYISNAEVTLSHTWVISNSTSAEGFGGGVYARESMLVVSDSKIIDNIAGTGGGIFLDHIQMDMSNVSVHNNRAGYEGSCQHSGGGLNVVNNSEVTISNSTISFNGTGGILMQEGNMVVSGSRIEDNMGIGYTLGSSNMGGSGVATADLSGNLIQVNTGNGVWTSSGTAITLTDNLILDNGGGNGGGVGIEGRAVVIGNTIQGNQATRGGGVYLNGAGDPILFLRNIVRENTSSDIYYGNGGGIYITGQDVTLVGNLVQNNHAGGWRYSQGGGIYIAGDAVLINNIVTDNGAVAERSHGSGIAVAGAQPLLYHTTIARNLGGAGEGIYVSEFSEPGLPMFYNTIIAEQTIGIQVSSTGSMQNMATLYGVLWWNNGINSSGNVFTFNETTGDPLFVNPAGYDYHISLGSAAIDNGVTTSITDDIDGDFRPHYAGYDLGADEWMPLSAVKSATPIMAGPDQVVTYTLTLNNRTSVPMSVQLNDTLPNEVGYIGPLYFNNGSGSYASGTVTWTGEVLTTTSTVINWAVQVLPSVSAGTIITNTATVNDAYGLFQTNPAVVEVPHRIYSPFVFRE
jgi:uncharacterized repeat protein (TIGR01451 family)